MWELIDYETKYWNNGCDISCKSMYQIRNLEDKSVKWIDEFDFYKMKKLGLLK